MCKFVLLLKINRKMFLLDPWCIFFSQLVFSLNYMYAMSFFIFMYVFLSVIETIFNIL